MTVVAGIDVGNATTEVVVVRRGARSLDLLGADRLPTRGRKGSPESLRGAAALVRRMERALEIRVDLGVVAPMRAVETSTTSVPELAPRTGRLRVVAAGVDTPGGRGACVGVPMPFAAFDGHAGAGRSAGVAAARQAGAGRSAGAEPGPQIVALLPAGLDYRVAAERLRALRADGWPIGAVLVPGDEGVLISNRLGADVPVVDLVDTEGLVASQMLGVEVRDPGQSVRTLSDPVALGAAFALEGSDLAGANLLSRLLLDCSNAVVALEQPGDPPAPQATGWIDAEGTRGPFREVASRLGRLPPGSVNAFAAPGSQQPAHVEDLWAVDLGAVADGAGQRKGSLASRAFVLAALFGTTTADAPAVLMSELLETEVLCASSETAAARLGALTTPGAVGDALVIDIGAGTIDVIATDSEVVAAGAGEMLTTAVGTVLGLPLAAADWVKRGPSVRVDGGRRYEAEDGTHGFLERVAAPAATGMLAVAGPAGLMTFDRRHSPAEWRALRLALKEAVLAANLRRALLLLAGRPRQALIVGGPTGDDEVLGVLARSLPEDVAVGRGEVGGSLPGSSFAQGHVLGHRYAAALGLAMSPEASGS